MLQGVRKNPFYFGVRKNIGREPAQSEVSDAALRESPIWPAGELEELRRVIEVAAFRWAQRIDIARQKKRDCQMEHFDGLLFESYFLNLLLESFCGIVGDRSECVRLWLSWHQSYYTH